MRLLCTLVGVARIDCVRCGFEWEVATQRKPENYCPSCRAKQVQTVDIGGDKCHPWQGRFAVDDVTPIWEDGSPVKPGRRSCGHSDCVNSRHIVEGELDGYSY